MGRTGHGKIMFLLLVVCLVLIDGTMEERTLTNYEIRRHLKRLNKPAVTSIKVVSLVLSFARVYLFIYLFEITGSYLVDCLRNFWDS